MDEHIDSQIGTVMSHPDTKIFCFDRALTVAMRFKQQLLPLPDLFPFFLTKGWGG